MHGLIAVCSIIAQMVQVIWATSTIAELGFKGEMNNVQSDPMLLTQSAPKGYLREMLSQWLQWAPGDGRGSTGYASKESLQASLLRANLGQLAQQFQ